MTVAIHAFVWYNKNRIKIQESGYVMNKLLSYRNLKIICTAYGALYVVASAIYIAFSTSLAGVLKYFTDLFGVKIISVEHSVIESYFQNSGDAGSKDYLIEEIAILAILCLLVVWLAFSHKGAIIAVFVFGIEFVIDIFLMINAFQTNADESIVVLLISMLLSVLGAFLMIMYVKRGNEKLEAEKENKKTAAE